MKLLVYKQQNGWVITSNFYIFQKTMINENSIDYMDISQLISQGNKLKNERKFDQAIAVYEKIIELNPNSPLGYTGLAQVYYQIGKFGQAFIRCESALKIDSNFIPALSLMGEIFEKEDKLDEAANLHRSIIKLQPANGIAYASLAKVETKLGNTQIAIESYEKALSFQQKLPEWVYKGLGDSLYKIGHIDKAISIYRQAIQLYPDSLYSYRRLLDLGYLNEAYQCFEQVLSKDPNHIVLEKFYLLPQVTVSKQHIRKALEILESCKLENSNDISLLLNISRLARKAQEIEKAEKFVKMVLELEPNNNSALMEMGKILEDRQEWQEAIGYYRKSNQPKSKANLLRCIYNSDSSAENTIKAELKLVSDSLHAASFIKNTILSKLGLDYENSLILYHSAMNVGDLCKDFSLIKPLCIQHQKKAIVIYPQKNIPELLAGLFLDPITPQYIIKHCSVSLDTNDEIIRLTQEDEISLDHIPVIPGIPRIVNNMPQHNHLTYITGPSIYPAGKAANLGLKLELDKDTLGKPTIQNSSALSAERKFNELRLSPGRAVLIAPHSATMNAATGSNFLLIPFWRSLIEKLVNHNFVPVINSRHRQENLDYLSKTLTDGMSESVRFVDLSVDEVIPFVELCGAFTGVRSGLCDLVAFSSSNVTKLCVHPKRSCDNSFGKLPGTRVPDETLINENFHLYFASVKDIPDHQEISRIFQLIYE